MRDGDFVEGVRALLVDKVTITNFNDHYVWNHDKCFYVWNHYYTECVCIISIYFMQFYN